MAVCFDDMFAGIYSNLFPSLLVSSLSEIVGM